MGTRTPGTAAGPGSSGSYRLPHTRPGRSPCPSPAAPARSPHPWPGSHAPPGPSRPGFPALPSPKLRQSCLQLSGQATCGGVRVRLPGLTPGPGSRSRPVPNAIPPSPAGLDPSPAPLTGSSARRPHSAVPFRAEPSRAGPAPVPPHRARLPGPARPLPEVRLCPGSARGRPGPAPSRAGGPDGLRSRTGRRNRPRSTEGTAGWAGAGAEPGLGGADPRGTAPEPTWPWVE